MNKLDKVKEELMKVIEKEVQDYTDEVYRSGHEDGVKSVQLLGNRARDIGREEAWECAKSIINFALDKREAIFGADNSVWSILNYCSASEAMQKIKDYEDEKVKKCGKCLISYNGASCSSCEEERQNEETEEVHRSGSDCVSCKYRVLDFDDYPCCECCNSYTSRWEKSEDVT